MKLTLNTILPRVDRMKLVNRRQASLQQRLRSRRSSGAIAIEFAMCVPVLFALLFGCYEVARANLMHHAAESAAYEGARVGIIPGATEDEIRAATEFVLTSVGVTVYTINTQQSVSDEDVEQVTVEIQVPFDENFKLGTFFVNDPTFRGQCTLARETF